MITHYDLLMNDSYIVVQCASAKMKNVTHVGYYISIRVTKY